MLELDGGVYPFVKTTKENTDDIVDFINTYATEHNIPVQIDKNKANTLYMMLFGIGYLSTILQKLIRSAADSNSIQNSSAKQLDLIAETMHTSRKAATYSIVDVDVTYTISIELDSNAYFTVQQTDGKILTFIPSVTTLLDGEIGSHMKTVQYKCTEEGPVYIPDGIISQLSIPINGIEMIYNKNCVKGAVEETTSQLRERLQKRVESTTRVDRCSMALSDLQGVSKASVLYNPSIDTTFNIIKDNIIQIENYQSSDGYGPFIVPPRKACVFIAGDNDNIPSTFFDHMICLTTNAANGDITFNMQSYTTRSGQILPFYYARPIPKNINIYIYTLNPVTQEISDNIKNAISTLISDLNIGQSISDGEIIKTLYTLYPDLDITGVTFTYNDYYIVSTEVINHEKLDDILTYLNSHPECIPGYELDDELILPEPLTLYGNMIIKVINDDEDFKNVPYILIYDSASLGDKWSYADYFSVHPEMKHEGVHSVTSYPYEIIQTDTTDESYEHISVIAGRVS